MSDYTPSTQEVSDWYTLAKLLANESSNPRADFERWRAEEIRKAYRDGYQDGHRDSYHNRRAGSALSGEL